MATRRQEKLDESTITGAFQNIKETLNKMSVEGSITNEALQEERYCVNKLESMVEALKSEVMSLAQEIVGLHQIAEDTRQERLQIDEEYQNLLQQKVEVLEEERYVRSQLQVQDMQKRLEQDESELESQDVEAEKNLLEFTREDLTKKTEDLDILEKRLEEKRMDYDREWEGFKDDIRNAREEKRPYIKNLQEFDNLIMARFKGILRFAPQALGEKERTCAEQTIMQLELQKELDEEKEKFLDMDILSRDLRHNANHRQLERRALWKQFDTLQQEKRTLQKTDDLVGTLLHDTNRMENLVASPRELIDSIVFDSGDNELAVGGRALHRVHKNLDVSVPLSEEEKQEFQNMLYDGEDISDTEGEQPDTDVDKHDVNTTIHLDQDLANQSKPSSDLGGAGPSDKQEEQEDSNEDKHPDDSQREPGHQDVAKTVLERSEASSINPTGLISKLRSRMGGVTVRTDPVTGQPIRATGSGMAFPMQRHTSDSRYKVDTKFLQKRGRR